MTLPTCILLANLIPAVLNGRSLLRPQCRGEANRSVTLVIFGLNSAVCGFVSAVILARCLGYIPPK